MASDLMNVGATGKYYKVKSNGKAQSGLSKGDRVVTDGGVYQILGVNGDGSYQSALYDSNTTTKNYNGQYSNGYNSNNSDLSGISSIKDSTKNAYDTAKNKDYLDNDSIKSAQDYYDSVSDNKPSAYDSEYRAQIDKLMSQIENREDFKYDLDSDMLYQQYKDQFVNLGQSAMQDTIGQASALTGGYGNSYAATAGSQAYQSYLEQLNDKVPDLYNLALNKYQMDSNEMLNLYNMYKDADATDYDRYMNKYDEWFNEKNSAYNALQNETDRAQSDYYNNLDQMNNIMNLENSDYWNEISQNNTEKNQDFQQSKFDYEKEQDALNRELAASKKSSGSSSGTSKSSGKSVTNNMITELQNAFENEGQDAALELAYKWTDLLNYSEDSVDAAWEWVKNHSNKKYYYQDIYDTSSEARAR